MSDKKIVLTEDEYLLLMGRLLQLQDDVKLLKAMQQQLLERKRNG